MAEPKEIGTVWTLGCEVFIEDALTAEVQEIKVNDIALSANVFTEGLSVEVGSDRVNAMDLDVRISMDGLKTYIIDSQIVPYEDVLKITDFSPEATNEKRYASSANTSKKIIDSVDGLEGRVNVAEGDIDSLEKRLDRLELNGTGGGFWYLGEDGKIYSDQGIVVRGDAIVEGDTSSGGEGEDVVVGIQGVRVNGTTHYDDDGDGVVDLGTIESGGGGGLTSVSWGDIKGTPPSVSTFDNDVPYVDESTFNSFSEDVNTAISEVSGDIEDLSTLLSSMWHLDENGNLVTDKQVLIKNSLIVDGDTSSGGDGQDTPSGGISGVKVNGVTYYDDNGDGIVDLGTISGGGGTADLSNYYTKSQSDARYLALSGGTINGDLSLNQYLRINAWAGYGSGSADAWYNGNTQMLLWENVSGMGLGSNVVLHSGNIGSYKAGGLATPRTIWGQSFDGTSNVDGSFVSSSDSWTMMVNSSHEIISYHASGKYLNIGYSTASDNYSTYINGYNLYLRYGANATTGITLNSLGNVLVGTTTDDASHKVQVDGALKVYEASQRRLYTRINSAGVQCGVDTSLYTGGWNGGVTIGADNSPIGYVAGAYLEGGTLFKLFYGGTSFSNASIVLNGLGGNVGIGITSPSAKLDVNGTIATNQYIRINAWTGYGSGSCDMWYDGGITTLEIRSSVKITKDLIVAGDTSSGSDIRFKDVIKNKTLKIEHIAKAPLFTFKWNDREDDTIHLGSSAQYWEKVTPWLVKGEDFKTLDYSTLGVAMGISLAKKAVNHEERIKVLEKEIKRLKEEMIHG